MATREIDVTKAEEFAGRMLVQMLNERHAHVADQHRPPGTPVRHDGRAARPATSAEIATAAGLDERYVREWLAGMTVGGDRRARPRGRHLHAAA